MSKSISLANRILIGMAIGIVAALFTLGIGHFHAPTLDLMRKVSTAVFDPFGQVFLRMLFFVVMPLVFASLTAGVVQLGRPDRIGPLALRTFAMFFANMAIGVTIGLLWVYWDAVPKENFANASWLMGRFVTEPGSAARVLLAVAVTAIALLIAIPMALTGYYAWAGYRWSRISGTVGAVLSFGALTLNVYAWSTIPLAVVAAGLLWTPPASRYFVAWWARRHPQQVFAPPTVDVYYGPLPKYRTD